MNERMPRLSGVSKFGFEREFELDLCRVGFDL